MKNNKRIKVFVSILCTLALLISNLSPLSWNSNSMDEVQAADWDGLTELTWADFGIAIGREIQCQYNNCTLTAGKTISDSLLNVDVKMATGTSIRYLGTNENSGVIIKVQDDGQLFVGGCGGWLTVEGNYTAGETYSASDYNMGTSFAGQKFNLKIAVTDYNQNSKATVRIWINDQIVGTSFVYNVSETTVTSDDGSGIMTLYEGTITPYEYVDVPTGLTELTWSDFGIAIEREIQCQYYNYTLTAGKTISDSLLNVDVKMATGTSIRYLGTNENSGVIIKVQDDGQLFVGGCGGWVTVEGEYTAGETYSASDYNMGTSFAGQKFNLKIAVTDYNQSSKATVRIWINDQIVGTSFVYNVSGTTVTSDDGSGIMTLYEGTITPYESSDVPTGLTELTWTDFGIVCGSNIQCQYNNYTLTSGKTISDSLLNVDVKMFAGTEIRYLGTDENSGVIIRVQDDGQLFVGGCGGWVTVEGEYTAGETYSASDYNMGTSFAGQKFNLKIAVTDYNSSSSATVRIWVNNQLVGTSFVYNVNGNETTVTSGNGKMTLYTGTITLYESSDKPTDLTELTWSDFEIPCSKPQTSVYGQLVAGKEINNSLFNGDITMQAGSNIRYLGNADHTGLIIAVTDAGALNLSTAGMWSNDLGSGVEFSADTFGLTTFANTRFNLKIAVTEYTDSSAKVKVYVNDQIVGAQFTLGEGTLGTRLSLYTGTIEPDYVLHELTWSDFAISCSKPQTSVYGQLVGGKEINNSLFNGDVTMQANSDIRYLGVDDYQGLIIAVTDDGALELSTATGWSSYLQYGKEFSAALFGLDSFADTRFNLKIAVTEYQAESVTVRIWVNDQLVGETIEISGGAMGTRLSLYTGTIEPDYILRELTWSDFGIPCNGKQSSVYGQLSSDKEINNSLFNGDIIMQAGSDIRYLGVDDYQGLIIAVTDGGALELSTATGWSSYLGYGKEFTADAYGLETFADTRFNLKMAVTEYAETSATVRIWVNDQLVGEALEISGGNMGTRLSLYTGTIEPSYINGTSVPTGLTNLTWEDFGFTCIGQYTANPNGGVYGKNGTLTSGKEMNNTLFNGDVIMQAGSEIRCIGAADFTGLVIGVNANGDLRLSKAAVSASYLASDRVFSAETFGLSSFANTKFNLKVTITDYSSASAKIGVWVNEQMVGDYFTLEGVTDYPLGNYMTFYNGTIEPHSTITKPTGLTEIHFGDWNAGVYGDNVLSNGELNGDVSHPDVDTLLNTSLKENVKFTGPGASEDGKYIFCWGGLKAEGKTWYGLRIDFVGDTMKLYKVNNDATSSSSNHFTLTADTLGIDGFGFYDREYLWQVDITQLGDNVLVWMYFDGILYGNAPIVMPNLASEMSDTLVFSPLPEEGVERSAALGASERTLSDLYHDLDVNAYVVSSGIITMQKKNIVDGNVIWQDMVINGGETITVAGDYKIKFNDGVSDYIQEVVLYRSGDTKINDQNTVGAADLVRLIKQTKEGVDVAYKCEQWAYDVNSDFVIDTETDSMKNAEVVTLREMILDIYEEDASDKMTIVGFAGPTGNMIKNEVYQKIQKLGITLIIENGSDHPYSDVPANRYYTYEQLTLAQKYGLKMTVPDQRLIDNRTTVTEADVTQAMEYYKDYQSFAGLFIIDEPVTTSYPPYYLSYTNPDAANFSEYANLAMIVNNMEVNGQKLIAYSNALGYCYQHVNDVTSPYKYMDYLNGFVADEEYGNQFVSATYYPFLGEHVNVPDEGAAVSGSDYFKHLALNRYVANESGNPLWTFVQAGDSFEMTPDDDPLTEGEFKWSANMGLAFGAKGIQYFSLIQPTNSIFHQSPMGLLDYNGAENEAGYYDWAIDVNKELTAIDDILMNATSMGIMTTGTYATEQAAENVKDIELFKSKIFGAGLDSQGNAGVEVYSTYEGATVTCATDSTYGTLTGCFETSDGKHALFIVNYNVNQANTVAVNVGSGVAATIIHEGNTTEATGSAYITLGAGEAALVVF